MPRETVLFIVGPTGVGKTSLSVSLAGRANGEIISADSMQAYKGMDIISQQPDERACERIPHHLINRLEPAEEYSAARFVKEAAPVIREIIKRGRFPIVVGGSGLYVKALVDGLFPSPAKDVKLREGLAREAEEAGPGALHDRLRSVDPAAASAIHPRDTRRIIRALEVFYLTGVPVSEHKKKTKGLKDSMDVRQYGLTMPREALYKRINERVEKMFGDGLVEEVRRLREMEPGMTARASLGYKEVLGYIEGSHSLDEARELLKRNTRRFARRQYTWFNADKRIEWIDLGAASLDEAVNRIASSAFLRCKKAASQWTNMM